MRDYELTFIVAPEPTGEGMQTAIDRVSQLITDRSGIIAGVNTESLGHRRLAYPIKHHLEGNYVIMRLQMDPSRTAELEYGLKYSEGILRHLLVNLE